ncbi:hypothetical protein [Methylobacterium sp. J-070]|uniref:hypothetical protein n=1 Tax=Methylobacterium sp. J-070 TaxID=2836650 RepID=UPI001FB9675E|nr:hypothetical protein [Methylobacterium sp. J-070]MCJ2048407.1 hypothetical protein [Methylobacterium sp. J-070]
MFVERLVHDVVAGIGGQPRSGTVPPGTAPGGTAAPQPARHPVDHLRTTIGPADDPGWEQLDLSFVDLPADVADDIWSYVVVPRTLRSAPAADVALVGEVGRAIG